MPVHPGKKSIDWTDRLPGSAPEPGNSVQRYGSLDADRSLYLESARDNSAMTLPSLVPYEDTTNSTKRHPWQGIGAEGVGHLAAKFNLALFPPSTAFFRLQPDQTAMDNVAAMLAEAGVDADEWRNKLEASAAAMEQNLMELFDQVGARAQMHKCFQHLVVAGNALLYLGEEECWTYPMDRYVIRRTAGGKPLEIVIRELHYPEMLPDAFVKKIYEERTTPNTTPELIEVYTQVRYDYAKDTVYWWQEAFNMMVPDSRSSAPIAGSPWIPMRYDSQYGSAWAEGLVSQLYGGLRQINGMERASAEGYANSLRLLMMIRPGSMVTREQLKEAESMEVLQGDPGDVSVVQGGKTQDLAAARAYQADINQKLQQRFAMPLSIQRKGERVTAAEIEFMAAQLESITTGFYSLFSGEVQRPIVTRLLHLRGKQGMPGLDSLATPDGEPLIQIHPITGVAALGRNDDLRRLMQLVQVLQSFLPPEMLPKYASVAELVQRITTAMGVNVGNLIYSPEEVARREQAEAEQLQAQQDQQLQAQQQQREVQEEQAIMNSSVVAELIRQGAISADDLAGLEGASPTEQTATAGAVRPGPI